jgi:hypothetical protein
MSNAHADTIRFWECKECFHPVADEDSVAFHLVDGVLYGWCRSCFNSTTSRRLQQTEKASFEKSNVEQAA